MCHPRWLNLLHRSFPSREKDCPWHNLWRRLLTVSDLIVSLRYAFDFGYAIWWLILPSFFSLMDLFRKAVLLFGGRGPSWRHPQFVLNRKNCHLTTMEPFPTLEEFSVDPNAIFFTFLPICIFFYRLTDARLSRKSFSITADKENSWNLGSINLLIALI